MEIISNSLDSANIFVHASQFNVDINFANASSRRAVDSTLWYHCQVVLPRYEETLIASRHVY